MLHASGIHMPYRIALCAEKKYAFHKSFITRAEVEAELEPAKSVPMHRLGSSNFLPNTIDSE